MKTDITISKKMTINTDNFSSINPFISLTIKDVNLSKVQILSEHLSNIVDNLLQLEIADLSDLMADIQNDKWQVFTEIGDQRDEIKNDIQNILDKMKEI